MKFKYSKMIPGLLRNTLDTVSEYAMYAKLSDYSSKSRSTSTTEVINMYRIWHLFDGSVLENDIPGMANPQLTGKYRLGDEYDNDYYYGLPSFADLVMYITVLIMKKHIMANAEQELELFRRGIKLAPAYGAFGYDSDNIVSFLEQHIKNNDMDMLRNILDQLSFVNSGTSNDAGLQHLKELVDGYTLIVDVSGYASLRVRHYYGAGMVNITPAYMTRSPNADILHELCEESPIPSSIAERVKQFREAQQKIYDSFVLPEFTSRYVVFKKSTTISLTSTSDDIVRDYGHLLQSSSIHKKVYYTINDIDRMREIHQTIKDRIPSNVTCRALAELHSPSTSKGKNFKVKMRLPKTVLQDDPERFKRILDKLSEIDRKFLMSDSHQGLGRNIIHVHRNLDILKGIVVPDILERAIVDAAPHNDIIRGEIVYSLRNQLDIIETLAPTKFGSVYKKFDDSAFNVLAEVYYRKNLTISFHTDSLNVLNRLKLLGLEMMSIEYNYYFWEDVLEYLENR